MPKPFYGMAPRTVLGSKWWDQTRKECYAAHDYHCFACGNHQDAVPLMPGRLEGHEFYVVDYKARTVRFIEAVALCHACHNYIHQGRMEAMVEKGEMKEGKYFAIIEWGDSVLQNAGLEPKIKVDMLDKGDPTEDWSDWRMIIEGKEYPPRFRTWLEWDMEYNGPPRKRK